MNMFQKEKEEHKELAEKEMGLMHKLMQNLRLAPLAAPPSADDDAETIKSRAETMENILKNEEEMLTFEEREKANFDVHGLGARRSSRSAEDGPSLVEQGKLVDLDNELIRLGVDKGRVNPLIQDQDYRLMFLRCDQLDVKVAAQRIKKNLEVKRELFGESCLNREITMSDLDSEDLEALHSGFTRVSQQKDIAGRTVVFMRHDMKLEHLPPRAYYRSQYYRHMDLMLRSVSCQQKGIVLVALHVGPPPGGHNFPQRHQFSPAKMLQTRRLRAALPKRLAAFHFCMVDENASANGFTAKASNLRRMFFNRIQLMMPADHRNRFRKHYGSKERIEFELGAFGITIQPADWSNVEDNILDGTSTVPIDVDPTPLAEMTEDTTIDPASLADIAYMMDTDLDPIPISAMDTREASMENNDIEPIPLSATETRGVSMGSSETSASSTHNNMEPTSGSTLVDSNNVTPEPSDSSNTIRMPATVSSTTPTASIVPTDEDVLFGRGRKTMNHPGNLHLRELVNLHRDEYETASKQRKTAIAQNIADTVLQSNRRFLKYEPEEDRWVHADVQTTRNKISHIYRNTRNKKK